MASRFRVTEHAVLRYLERVKGVDIKAVRREIFQAINTAEDFDGACAVVHDGMRYKIVDDTVVTVVPAAEANKRLGRK